MKFNVILLTMLLQVTALLAQEPGKTEQKKWPDRIVLISMAAKAISEQGSMVMVSYKIVINNGSSDIQRRDIVFRFIDGEGFMLEHDLKYKYFLKSGTNIISDTASMSKKAWAAVKSYDVELEDHY